MQIYEESGKDFFFGFDFLFDEFGVIADGDVHRFVGGFDQVERDAGHDVFNGIAGRSSLDAVDGDTGVASGLGFVRVAAADGFRPAFGLARRPALWAIKGLRDAELPLFAAAIALIAPFIFKGLAKFRQDED